MIIASGVVTIAVPIIAVIIAGIGLAYTYLSLRQTARLGYVQMLEGEVRLLKVKLDEVDKSEKECVKRCLQLEKENYKLLRRVEGLEDGRG